MTLLHHATVTTTNHHALNYQNPKRAFALVFISETPSLRTLSTQNNTQVIATVLVGVIIVVGLVGYGYYATSSSLASLSKQNTNLSQQVAALAQQVSSLAQSSTGGGGLYIVGVEFTGSNVTVNIGDSGGGVPIPPGYGDTGVMGQYFGAIIIQDGSVYYHYNWNCQLSTPCATAPWTKQILQPDSEDFESQRRVEPRKQHSRSGYGQHRRECRGWHDFPLDKWRHLQYLRSEHR